MPSEAVKATILLLDELCEVCGYDRGRKPVYAKEVVAVIKPIWLPHFERREGDLSKALRRSVLAASAATLDRLLSPYRSAHPKRWRAPKPGTLIKAQVPVRTDNHDITEPGSIEADSVAHCGDITEPGVSIKGLSRMALN
jgi:hypothetical protein